MNILGINLRHDSSSTLIKNRKIIAACEEERYTKKKHTREFPFNAIKNCLKIGKTNLKEIDIIRTLDNENFPSYFFYKGKKFIIKNLLI